MVIRLDLPEVPERLHLLVDLLRETVEPATMWVALPEIYLALKRETESGGESRRRGQPVISRLFHLFRGEYDLIHDREGEELYVATSTNQARVLNAIAGKQLVATRRSMAIVGEVGERLVAVLPERNRRIRSAGFSSREAEVVTGVLSHSARALNHAEVIVNRIRPRVLVIATQHNPYIRALTLRAAERGVATTYFPHAPAASNLAYSDAPFNTLGLRGQAEVDLYQNWGVSPQRMDIAGVPSFELADGPQERRTPILALSNWPGTLVERVVSFVQQGVRGTVCVAPHPANEQVVSAMLPKQWHLNVEPSTGDLLRRSMAPVIQMSSGIAWEAASLGLPVIQLSLEDRDANYPFIQEPFVHFVSTPEHLGRIVDSGDWHDPVRSTNWARYWGWPLGPEAVRQAREVVQASIAADRNSVALDRWGSLLGSDALSELPF